MEDKNVNNTDTNKKEFTGFAIKRIALGVLLTFAGLWIFGTVLGLFDKPTPIHVAQTHDSGVAETGQGTDAATHGAPAHTPGKMPADHGSTPDTHVAATTDASHTAAAAGHATGQPQPAEHGTAHGTTVVLATSPGHGSDTTPDTVHTASSAPADTHGTPMDHATESATVSGHAPVQGADTAHGTGQAAAGYAKAPSSSMVHAVGPAAVTGQTAGHGADLAQDTQHAATTVRTDTHGATSGHVATAVSPVASSPSHGSTDGHGTSAAQATGHGAAPDQGADHGTTAEHAAPVAHATGGGGDAHGTEAADHGDDGHGDGGHGVPIFTLNMPGGVAFIESAIYPLNYELTERRWGWRPNDNLNVTDNVNNFQLGVLEVTRRTAVALAERLSRTGSTASFDRNLENAMNWFMIRADRYWFPSPESKYKAGLAEWGKYRERLVKGEAQFHTRTDNLIPLLMAFEDLLGSCDENLAKANEDDGTPVSHFKADDYFYYAQGVASAMHTILLAVQHDFAKIIESRRGSEVIHHAIESCHHAVEIDPIYITNASLSGILANHRANLAAPISHARFYIGVLIKTLST